MRPLILCWQGIETACRRPCSNTRLRVTVHDPGAFCGTLWHAAVGSVHEVSAGSRRALHRTLKGDCSNCMQWTVLLYVYRYWYFLDHSVFYAVVAKLMIDDNQPVSKHQYVIISNMRLPADHRRMVPRVLHTKRPAIHSLVFQSMACRCILHPRKPKQQDPTTSRALK